MQVLRGDPGLTGNGKSERKAAPLLAVQDIGKMPLRAPYQAGEVSAALAGLLKVFVNRMSHASLYAIRIHSAQEQSCPLV